MSKKYNIFMQGKEAYIREANPNKKYTSVDKIYNEIYFTWQEQHANDPLIHVLTPNALELLAGKDTVSGDEVTDPVWQWHNGEQWYDCDNIIDNELMYSAGIYTRLTCHLKEQVKGEKATIPNPYTSPWISVKDRLPEPYGRCNFVFQSDDKEVIEVFGGVYVGSEYGSDDVKYLFETVSNLVSNATHWSPLPEPPKI